MTLSAAAVGRLAPTLDTLPPKIPTSASPCVARQRVYHVPASYDDVELHLDHSCRSCCIP
jgi:hypothetical protein